MAQKCKCNWAWWIISLILMTIGLWVLVTGFVMQFNSTAALATVAQAVMPWYFAGILIFGLGKMAKWKCFGACMMHKK